MEALLYELVKFNLKRHKINYKYYSLYNSQFLNNSKDEGIQYPAILLEILPTPISASPLKVKNYLLAFRLHLATELYSSFREKDSTNDEALTHLKFVESVWHSIDNKSSDDEFLSQYLVDNQGVYQINTIDLNRKQYNVQNKSLFITQLDFTAHCSDQSNNYYNDYQDFTVNSLTGTTYELSGSTYNGYVRFGGTFR